MRRLTDETGAQRLIGYVIHVPEEATPFVTLSLGERHLNRHGVVHGGILASLLDIACGMTMAAELDRATLPPVTTVSMTANYLAPARAGTLTARARITGGGRATKFLEAVVEDAAGTTIATASTVMKQLRDPAAARAAASAAPARARPAKSPQST
ncbi:MAG: PaaI family thioesterase [Pseudomonadota bacterium]